MTFLASVGKSTISAHPPYTNTPLLNGAGSDFVTVNGAPAAVLGTTAAPHTGPGLIPPHVPVVAAGSSFVTYGGIPAARNMDLTQCGGFIIELDPFVTILA